MRLDPDDQSVKTSPYIEFCRHFKKEKPVDIIKFATHPDYCGKKLYPEQRVILKTIYKLPFDELEQEIFNYWEQMGYIPTTLRERMDGSLGAFREVVLVIGRRGSKTFLSAIIAAYTAYKLILMGNPQEHYGIEEGKEIFIYCIARSGSQTKRTIYADVYSTIVGCKFFEKWIYPSEGLSSTEIKLQTQWDKEKEEDMRRKGIRTSKPMASIRILSLNSNSASLRGPAVICTILTEIAHFIDTEGRLSGGAVYDAVDPAIKQFGDDGMMILESTPWSQTGKFYEQFMLANGVTPEGDELEVSFYKHLVSFQISSWEMYRFAPRAGMRPIIQWEDIMHLQATHPDSFWIEYGAIFATTMDAYLDPELVDQAIDPRVEVREKGIHKFTYKFHCDPSTTGANFGVVGGHKEKIEDSIWKYEFAQAFWNRYLVVIDYIRAYRPSEFPEGIVDYIQIEDNLIETGMGFRTESITFDQWNSAGSIQKVRRGLSERGKQTNVSVTHFTEPKNFDRYEILKTALMQRRVKIPPGKDGTDPHLLKLELKFLKKDKRNKVEKQDSGPITTKDLADCLGVVVQSLLGDIRTEENFPKSELGLQTQHPSQFTGGSRSFDDFYNQRGGFG